jgi:hypothetical protein
VLLEENGYQVRGKHYPGRFRVEFSRGEGFPVVELHRSLLKGDTPEFLQGIWNRAVPYRGFDAGSGVFAMEETDLLFYLSAHAVVQHLVESPVWLNDLHFCLSTFSHVDWGRVENTLTSRRWCSAFWFLFRTLEKWSGPAHSDFLYSLQTTTGPVSRWVLEPYTESTTLFDATQRTWPAVLKLRYFLKDGPWDALNHLFSRQITQKLGARLPVADQN